MLTRSDYRCLLGPGSQLQPQSELPFCPTVKTTYLVWKRQPFRFERAGKAMEADQQKKHTQTHSLFGIAEFPMQVQPCRPGLCCCSLMSTAQHKVSAGVCRGPLGTTAPAQSITALGILQCPQTRWLIILPDCSTDMVVGKNRVEQDHTASPRTDIRWCFRRLASTIAI